MISKIISKNKKPFFYIKAFRELLKEPYNLWRSLKIVNWD